MRFCLSLFVVATVALITAGCGPPRADIAEHGPTVPSFTGRLVQDGKPVSFPSEDKVRVEVFHEKGRRFGIPIQPDGTFKIGWMPIGKYSAMLVRNKPASKGPIAPEEGKTRLPRAAGGYQIPDGFTIQEGKTDYTIELGPEWNP
jgi:hypothetical protein